MNEYSFTIVLEREDEGGYHAFCPALHGCHTQGETYEKTLENIKDAIKIYLESLQAHRENIPSEEDIAIKPVRVTV